MPMTARRARRYPPPSRSGSVTSEGKRKYRTSLGVQCRIVELVPDSAHGQDQLGLAVVALDPRPQAPDVHVDRPRLDVRVATPDQIEQLRAFEDAVRMAHEEREELELPEAQLHLLAVEKRLVRV